MQPVWAASENQQELLGESIIHYIGGQWSYLLAYHLPSLGSVTPSHIC